MSDATIWWVLTGVLVALELATGTFYLLMLGLGTGPRPCPRWQVKA